MQNNAQTTTNAVASSPSITQEELQKLNNLQFQTNIGAVYGIHIFNYVSNIVQDAIRKEMDAWNNPNYPNNHSHNPSNQRGRRNEVRVEPNPSSKNRKKVEETQWGNFCHVFTEKSKNANNRQIRAFKEIKYSRNFSLAEKSVLIEALATLHQGKQQTNENSGMEEYEEKQEKVNQNEEVKIEEEIEKKEINVEQIEKRMEEKRQEKKTTKNNKPKSNQTKGRQQNKSSPKKKENKKYEVDDKEYINRKYDKYDIGDFDEDDWIYWNSPPRKDYSQPKKRLFYNSPPRKGMSEEEIRHRMMCSDIRERRYKEYMSKQQKNPLFPPQ